CVGPYSSRSLVGLDSW
nr:immunoglobulin heavy chain junction region [Macaca mulatta]MOX40677.1 immunoglobulin heavy chain junction region [Macaca mulatta]MOX40895.1 immunoglobulin heavy chain junction region [Macaca mulatta]MOX41400.1 immunoglobulin heavy chain junction region [Macaca mulatta]